MRSKGELNGRAMYKRYKSLGNPPVEAVLFLKVLDAFNRQVIGLLLGGHTVKLPFNLGDLYVEKKKVNYEKLSLDYGHWQKTGEKVYHTNRHSDGYHAYFHWKKMGVNVTHKGLYRFVPARTLSRTLATVMKQEGGHKRYISYTYTPKVRPCS